MGAFLGITGVIALVGGIIYLAVQAEKKRTEGLRTAAQAMGFTFEEEASLADAGDFPLFNHGRSARLKNVSRGEIGGRPALMGEFSYTVSSGKNNHTVRQTIVVFTDDGALPEFDLSPENVFHKIGQVFGYQDIDFDGNEEFSKRYLLRGPDENAIRGAFNSSVLMQLESQPGWSAQCRQGRLMVFRAGKTTKAQDMPIMAADSLRIAGTFKGA